MPDIRVYFSFRSPYSRLGLHLIDRAGLDVELIPFTGPPDGAPFVDPSANPAKTKLLHAGCAAHDYADGLAHCTARSVRN